jgi:class 3 adenylate cyclase
VRSNLARFRGREVKTTGTGFLATFDGPARAIRAATHIATRVLAPRQAQPQGHPGPVAAVRGQPADH